MWAPFLILSLRQPEADSRQAPNLCHFAGVPLLVGETNEESSQVSVKDLFVASLQFSFYKVFVCLPT